MSGVPLRCQLCGEQVGLTSSDSQPDPELAVVRCYQCAAVEEAESITAAATPTPENKES